MARSRNIKPGLFKNEGLGVLPIEARLMFIGLTTLADREGRLEDRPARIAAELFPYDRSISAGDIDGWLDALAQSPEGFIVRYVVGNSRFISITNFLKHQSPHVKEQASTIPAPDMPGASPVQVPDIHQACTDLGSVLHPLIPSSLIPSKGVTGKNNSSESHGTRFSLETLPDEWMRYAVDKIGWNADQAIDVFETFRLHWISTAGAKGRKANWFATWQGWCRRDYRSNAMTNRKPKGSDVITEILEGRYTGE